MFSVHVTKTLCRRVRLVSLNCGSPFYFWFLKAAGSESSVTVKPKKEIWHWRCINKYFCIYRESRQQASHSCFPRYHAALVPCSSSDEEMLSRSGQSDHSAASTLRPPLFASLQEHPVFVTTLSFTVAPTSSSPQETLIGRVSF